jgi:quercetin dioxygenase-like cupin family protein
MKVCHYEQVRQSAVEMEGAEGCQVRWLIGQDDDAPNFAMRQYDVAVGGHTPKHVHAYEHEVFVLEGEGVVLEGDAAHALRAGDVVFIRPNEVHQFRNTGDVRLKFLCLIPNSASGQKVTVVPGGGC